MRLPVHLNYWRDLLPPLLGFSVGLSCTVAPLTTTVLSDAGPGDAGIASGVNNAVARVAGLVAVAVLGIVAAGGSDTSPCTASTSRCSSSAACSSPAASSARPG